MLALLSYSLASIRQGETLFCELKNSSDSRLSFAMSVQHRDTFSRRVVVRDECLIAVFGFGSKTLNTTFHSTVWRAIGMRLIRSGRYPPTPWGVRGPGPVVRVRCNELVGVRVSMGVPPPMSA